MTVYKYLWLLFVVFFVGCATKELRVQEYPVPADVPNPAKPPAEFYTIGAGDSLEVAVWKEPMLSGSVTVRPDGFITLPLVNEIQVVGLSTAELRNLLEQKYSEFVTSPSVTVRVTGIASNEILLLGEVARPGAYPLINNSSILEVLTKAGGLSRFADRDNIRVMRRSEGKVTEFVVDYDAILKGDLKQDILLRPGDRILVP
jgi:polysaccharide biosynthesis/export protein